MIHDESDPELPRTSIETLNPFRILWLVILSISINTRFHPLWIHMIDKFPANTKNTRISISETIGPLL